MIVKKFGAGIIIFSSMLLTIGCKSSISLEEVCQKHSNGTKTGNSSINCSAYDPIPAPPVVNSDPTSFTISGTVTGSNFTGMNLICSTVEAVPVEKTKTLTADGLFALSFTKTGEVPVRCLLADGANSNSIDVIFTEAVSKSIKSITDLKHLIVVRKKDTSAINLGTITYNDTNLEAESSYSLVSQNGVKALANQWTDLSGIWSAASDITLTAFINNMTGTGGAGDISEIRWNQTSATDDTGGSHTAISSWQRNTGSDDFAGCNGAEGFPLASGWNATVNPSSFANYSNPSADFSDIDVATGLADFYYANGKQNVCGIDLNGGLTTNALCSEVIFPVSYGALNQAQCKLLCVIKSIDALFHFATSSPTYNNCPIEYKTTLTSAALATQLPVTGNCSPANGSPCPGLIEKPERVLSRNFFEDAKVIADSASFYTTKIDTVRSCSDNNGDGDILDAAAGPFPADCNPCQFKETVSVVIRRLTSTQAYISQRISRKPLLTNDPLVCVAVGAYMDDAFAHRGLVLGMNQGVIADYNLSHTYLMNKN